MEPEVLVGDAAAEAAANSAECQGFAMAFLGSRCTRRRLLVLRLTLLVPMLCQVLLLAQSAADREDVQEAPLTIEQVRQARSAAERSQESPPDVRARILGLYDAALNSLEDAERFTKAAASFNAEIAVSEARIKALQEELDQQPPAPVETIGEDWTSAQLEERRTEAEAELAAARAALLDEDQLSSQRAARRREISDTLGTLNQRLLQIDDQIRYVFETETIAAVRIAEHTNLLARRQSMQAEIASLRAEGRRHVARAPALPLRRDRAQRRVLAAQQLVDMLSSAARAKRLAETRERLIAVHARAEEAVLKAPSLAPLAAETVSLAEELYGPGGMQSRIEDISRRLNATQKSIADIRQAFETSRRKWQIVGFHGTAVQWWPSVPIDLERPAQLRVEIRLRESQIPETQHQLILLEEKRASTGDVPRELAALLETLPAEGGDAAPTEVADLARDLLNSRRGLLDELLSNSTRHSSLLFELDAASRELLAEVEQLEDFVVARAVWIRSVPGSIFPAAEDIANGFAWLFANPAWPAAAETMLAHGSRNPFVALYVALLVVLFWLRRWCRTQLVVVADQADTRSLLTSTLSATLLTLLLAAPLPALLLGAGGLLNFAAQFDIARATSAGLYACAFLAAAIELISSACHQRGLVEAHFGWPTNLTLAIRNNSRLAAAFTLPPIFVSFALRQAGGTFHNPLDLQVLHNSLGRLSFVAAMIAISVFSYRALYVAVPVLSGYVRAPRWTLRFRPMVVLLVVSLSFAPAMLALFGYYLTAYLLVYFVFRSVWLALGLILLFGLLYSWEVRKRRRYRDKGILPGVLTDGTPAELPDADTQVRQLLRFGIFVVGIIGLFSIWGRFVPALQILDHIQVWPSIAVVSEAEQAALPGGLSSSAATALPGTQDSVRSEEPQQTQTPAAMPRPPGAAALMAASPGRGASSGASTAIEGADNALMLSDLLLAVFVIVCTIVAAKNIPGLIESSFLARLNAEAGVRIAMGTLVRYLVLIIGLSIGFGILGIRWSNIQWLAAALTFGLGFGLQEIFANFVSGLILLTERPIRVGDFVTVGATSGQVERIQMRATTIRAWDKSELVVPNKEFITGQLVNWTLSDPTARVEVRIGVAYGSDVQQVRAMLLELARRHPRVLADPEPMAYFMEFGASALQFELHAYIDFHDNRLKVRDELQLEISRVLHEKGITIAFPQMDVHIKPDSGSEGEPAGGNHNDS